MLFNSAAFLVFFPITTVLYFSLRHRYRWMLLLLASCVFYMSFVPAYILILLGTILVDYVAGLLIEPARGWKRRLCLTASLAANIGVLAFFKYVNFLDDAALQIASVLHLNYAGSPLKIVLPIGLSFHTFQAMSYTIEVYRGHQRAERHLGIYALYVMFYPQLVAGPIERPQNLLHQFREPHGFNYDRMCAGLTRMLWGLFKKMVIADRLAVFVDAAYSSPATTGRGWLVLATYLFAVQIYCDFSGYTDVALGAAQVMGFTLMENFNLPYAAASVADFWRRWHISLSTWFRDYLYFPLGGSRVSYLRWVFNILFVFLLSGLWHGANWGFIVWGLLNGVYLIVERSVAKDQPASGKAMHLLRVFVTFNLICFAWIFFRAETVTRSGQVLKAIFGSSGAKQPTPFNCHALPLMLILITFTACMESAQRGRPIASLFRRIPISVRWPAYYGLILCILWIGVLGGRSFIYFQF